MLEALQSVEAAEWVSILFERPEIVNKVYTLLQEYSVKVSAFLFNIQTLSIAAQAFLLQPLPKHPISFFDPLKEKLPLSKLYL